MSTERREYYRCQVPESEAPAILRTGKRDLVVQLVEESAGGFTVQAGQRCSVKTGQSASLATGSGRCRVKVVHVTDEDGESRIGLRRIREMNDGASPSTSLLGNKRTSVQLALILALCFVFFVWGSELSSGAAWWGKVTGETNASKSEHARRHQRHEKELAMNYLRLDQFKVPGFIERLDLSIVQQQQISGIIDNTNAALADCYRRQHELSPEDWAELGLRLMQATWSEIQTVLTEEQRTKWNAAVLESDSSASASEHQAPTR